MSTELGWVAERGGEIFVSKPLFFRLVSRKLFLAFPMSSRTTLVRVFFIIIFF